jgi:hypothetical protein
LVREVLIRSRIFSKKEKGKMADVSLDVLKEVTNAVKEITGTIKELKKNSAKIS